MAQARTSTQLSLRGLDDPLRLFGELDANLNALEQRLSVGVSVNGNELLVAGDARAVALASSALERLIAAAIAGSELSVEDVELAVAAARTGMLPQTGEHRAAESLATTRRGRAVRPRSLGQTAFVAAVQQNTLVFVTGPAGTGKTFLAVVMALASMREGRVQRIILARPAVEAGEKLGFLPGDPLEKVNPYVRPLFDALAELMDPSAVSRAMDRGQIEVAPLAFLRGRTLSDSFIVLDEAQNTTVSQLKMVLTRLGNNSRMVVCGDVTQVDLPQPERSGLVHAAQIFEGVPDIAVVNLTEADVVRHPLIRRIIDAYERDRR